MLSTAVLEAASISITSKAVPFVIVLHVSQLPQGSVVGCLEVRQFKDLANMMKKPLGFKNQQQLRDLINNYIKFKNSDLKKTKNEIKFLEEDILIKPLDYYYSNPIARSSKVMSDCRQISKKLLFTGIEKAS